MAIDTITKSPTPIELVHKVNELVDDANTRSSSTLGQISNCILEAPNGVFTASGNTLTIYSGLKVLIPDGRNADGSLRSITYTLDKNIIKSDPELTRSRRAIVYVDIDRIDNPVATTQWWGGGYDRFFVQDIKPVLPSVKDVLWFSPQTNIFQITADYGETWTQMRACVIGTFSANGTAIVSYKAFSPATVLKLSDMKYVGNWAFPSSNYIDYPLGASGEALIAPANGYVCFSFLGGTLAQLYNGGLFAGIGGTPSAGFGATGIWLPCKAGDLIRYYHEITTPRFLRFIYAQGEL